MPVRLGGWGLGNPSCEATREYASSVKVTAPLVERIVSQTQLLQDDTLVKSLQLVVKSQRVAAFKNTADNIRETAPPKIKRVLGLTAEKRSSVLADSVSSSRNGFSLSKGEFRDAIKLRYD